MGASESAAFEIRDHTADIQLRVFGGDERELFANALTGLYAVLGEIVTRGAGEPVVVELRAGGREELLHDWLAEGLFYAETRHAALRDVRIVELTPTSLRAEAVAAPMDLDRCDFNREIKAVTYHDLVVLQSGEGWIADVILDI